MARRRAHAPKAKPFDGAWEGIDKLEYAVLDNTVDPAFTLSELVRAFWHDAVVDKLTAAFNVTSTRDRSGWQETVVVPGIGAVGAPVSCLFHIRMQKAGMLCPVEGAVHFNLERIGPVLQTIQDAYRVHQQFEKVREVVRWLNTYATPGAARYYFPALCGVLPPEHEINKATGERYREPAEGLSKIAPVMREAATVLAGALMCNMDLRKRDTFTVIFRGQREGDDYSSNMFGLL